MRALVIPSFSGLDDLEVKEMPPPHPGPGQVLIRVEAGGLNFADVMTASGGYPGLPKPPLVAGREFAGVVEESGKRVMGYIQWGGFAEKATARADLLWPVPDSWSMAEAAAFPVNYFTAYFAYWKSGLLNGPAFGKKARVLIHAVAGGVGTAAVEIGRVLGIEMYGTSSSEDKLERVKKLGLQQGINYKQKDYEAAIQELTHGEGVDAVFEMLGGEHVQKSVRCLRDFGCVITYGAASGQAAQLDPRILYTRGTSVHGLWLSQLSKNKELMGAAWERLSKWIEEGRLHPVVGREFPVERAVEAYRLLAEGKNYGKIVLKM